jgi:hypothetical protein
MIGSRIVARAWAVQQAMAMMVMVIIVIVSEAQTYTTEHKQT